MFKTLVRYFFFGNFFIGLLGIALSIETARQLHLHIAWPFSYYSCLFAAIVLFYTFAYLPSHKTCHQHNERAIWYYKNRRLVTIDILIAVLIGSISGIYLIYASWPYFLRVPWPLWGGLSATAVFALLYDDLGLAPFGLNLRKAGWTKSLVIGFIWANTVTIFPIVMHLLSVDGDLPATSKVIWYYTQNFMFCTVNAILFDIKDYEEDTNKNLKTIVVRLGYRNVLNKIIIPLSILGIVALLLFSFYMQSNPLAMAVNLIPFFALLYVAFSLFRKRPILYYLIIIDGLLLLKACCGILSSYF